MKTSFVRVIGVFWTAAICNAQTLDYVAVKSKWREAMQSEWLTCIPEQAKIHELQMPVIDRYEKLLAQLPKQEGKTVGELMNPEQANEFGKLSQKMQFFTLQSLLVSKRERDLEVVMDLASRIISELEETPFRSDYKWDDKQSKLLEMLLPFLEGTVFKNAEEFDKIERINDKVEGAFGEMGRFVEKMVEERFGSMKLWKDAWEQRQKKKMVASELSDQEKIEFEKYRSSGMRAASATARIHGVGLLYTLMTINHRCGVEEATSSVGEISAIGGKMKAMLNKSSEPVQQMIQIVWLVNENIPCRQVRENEARMNVSGGVEKK